MDRRHFLAGAAVGGAALGHADTGVKADALKGFRITRVVGFRHTCLRQKVIGKNAYRDVQGREQTEQVLRIETDQGVEGVGVGSTSTEAARQLLGRRLADLWKPGLGTVGPLWRADHALFDLVGKALGVPAWKLLGGRGPEWVPVYDGSIYFSDLLPEYAGRGVGRVVEEVEMSLAAGHRAVKMKVGRGHRWMHPGAGFQRDVEVVQAVRKRIGRGVRLMVDANNAFDLDVTKRWLDAVGDDLFWIEEPFPEVVEQDLQLKEYLRKKGWTTRIADGESALDVSHFYPFIRSEAIDVFQPDIRAFGLTRQWALSRRMAEKPALRLAPHNWESFLGFYMQLILGRGISNFLMAEQDPSASDLFDVSAFTFKDGKVRVPDAPGCGLVVREDVFKKKYWPNAWVVR
jgi:L-alanine-DL-glutamate epimerase-like enolase superfamily enzyme